MLHFTTENETAKHIKEAFQTINDMVVPTMGARGRLAIIEQDFDRPLLTDDGVTVARQARFMEGFQKMIAIAMIEAAANTEKEAYDGTTLTILLTNELYKAGLDLIASGKHPQVVGDMLEAAIAAVRCTLEQTSIDMNSTMVRHVANISTKIKSLGSLVEDAYKIAGPEMNIVVEHDRKQSGIRVEHDKGLAIDSGYFQDSLRVLCNQGDKTLFEDAHIVLLGEGMVTVTQINNFFGSIPEEALSDPFVFFMKPDFDPNAMRILIEILTNSKFKFQFVFLNEERAEELLLDIAAITNAQAQSMLLATTDYVYDNTGLATNITIELDKTTIIGEGDTSIRIDDYNKRLKDHKFTIGMNEERMITRRLSALQSGIVKIKLGVATITEFQTLQMKLDDAIGAVRKAFETGVVYGGGKALYNIAQHLPEDMHWLANTLKASHIQILSNAGIDFEVLDHYDHEEVGIDVVSGKFVNLLDYGILDSRASIDAALKNAVSIASSYIRAYTMIRQNTKSQD